MSHRRFAFIHCCLAAALAWSSATYAQAYPARAITWIVPSATGGGVDVESRLYAQKMSEALGKSFVVDYKPGAGSTIGAQSID